MSLKYPIPASLLGLAEHPIGSIITPLTLGSLTGLITKTSVKDWYPNLKKPRYNPPRWLFPIAWSYLYSSMGYGSNLISRVIERSFPSSIEKIERAENLLRLYYLQLGLNLIWTPLFFGLRSPGLALLDILPLTGTVFFMTNLSRKVDIKATYIFLPYALWLSYATYLNSSIWYLNGGKQKILKSFDTFKSFISSSSSSSPNDDKNVKKSE